MRHRAMRPRNLPLLIIMLFTFALSGCVAEDNESALDLGSVSIGDQLIDLKKARDAGAISGREYRKLKADLMALVNKAAGSNRSDDDDNQIDEQLDNRNEEHEEEASQFLF